MRGWGIMCVILGIGSILLPRIGMQFMLMELFDDYQPFAAIGISLLGVVLIGASFFTGRRTNV
jgi:hypothetical protein